MIKYNRCDYEKVCKKTRKRASAFNKALHDSLIAAARDYHCLNVIKLFVIGESEFETLVMRDRILDLLKTIKKPTAKIVMYQIEKPKCDEDGYAHSWVSTSGFDWDECGCNDCKGE